MLEKFGISSEKIVNFVDDNVSNFVRAGKKYFQKSSSGLVKVVKVTTTGNSMA